MKIQHRNDMDLLELLRLVFGTDANADLNRSTIWTFVLVVVAYLQFRRANHISSADFIHRLKNDFFGKETRELFFLFEKDYLRFDAESEVFTLVRIDRRTREELGITRKFYTIYEVDDFILGDVYDLGLFEQKHIVDIDMVYEEFGYYVETIYANKAIRFYIDNQRRETKHRAVYDKLDYIGLKCRLYGDSKQKKRSLLRWRIRTCFQEARLRRIERILSAIGISEK